MHGKSGKKRLATVLLVILAIGALICFYYFAYRPFMIRKNLIYIKSDYQQSIINFDKLETTLSHMVSDNNIQTDYSSLYIQLEYLKLESQSNSNFISSSGNTNSIIGTTLSNYYRDVQYVVEQLEPKAAFAEFMGSVNAIADDVSAKATSTDNYYEIANYISHSLDRFIALENSIDDGPLANYTEVKTLAIQYLSDIKTIYSQMVPLVNSIPDYLSKNDRDQTRLIMKQINDLSNQLIANENNTAILIKTTFTQSQADLESTIFRLHNNRSIIEKELRVLVI